MKTNPLLLTLIMSLALIPACDRTSAGVGPTPLGPTAADGTAQGPPTGVPFEQLLPLINPCTGLVDTATISGMLWLHEGAASVRSESTITTASGFSGQRKRTIVLNDNTFKASNNAMLVNALGQRIRFHFILVVDERSGTVRVQQGGQPTCVR